MSLQVTHMTDQHILVLSVGGGGAWEGLLEVRHDLSLYSQGEGEGLLEGRHDLSLYSRGKGEGRGRGYWRGGTACPRTASVVSD